MADTPKPPDQPKPPAPAQVPREVKPPISQGDWRDKYQAQMQPPPPEKRLEGPQKLSPAEFAQRTGAGIPADRARQSPDAGKPRLSTDHREWTPVGKPIDAGKDPKQYQWQGGPVDVKRLTLDVSKDVNQYRQPNGSVDMNRLTTDIGKDIRKLSDNHPKDGGGAFLRVELRNVQTGKDGEAKEIQKNLVEAATKPGVIVNVTVRDGDKIKSTDGQVLSTASQPGTPKPPGQYGGEKPMHRPEQVPPGVQVHRPDPPPRTIQPHIPGRPH